MLKFRLGAVPVSVHLSFLILAFFGWQRYGRAGVEFAIAWTIGVFLAILAHEAGHAFTARAFGARNVAIMLFAFGGATTYPLASPMSPGRKFVVSAAGSAVGISTGAMLMVVGANAGWFDVSLSLSLSILDPLFRITPNVLVLVAVGYIQAALVWGILNWLPMRPLDGGHMLQSFLEIVAPPVAETGTKVVAVVIGVPVIAWAVVNQQIFVALIVGFLLYSGLRAGPEPGARPSQRDPADAGPTRPEVMDDPAGPTPPSRPAEAPNDPPEFPI